MNTELLKKAANNFEKDFVKLMDFLTFENIIVNVRKHRDLKIDGRINYLVSEPNFNKANDFLKDY